MTNGERGPNPNTRHHWLMSHLNQEAIFHHCSFFQPFISLHTQDPVIVIECDGAGIPRVSLWLQFNLVSTPTPNTLTFIEYPPTDVCAAVVREIISDASKVVFKVNTKHIFASGGSGVLYNNGMKSQGRAKTELKFCVCELQMFNLEWNISNKNQGYTV